MGVCVALQVTSLARPWRDPGEILARSCAQSPAPDGLTRCWLRSWLRGMCCRRHHPALLWQGHTVWVPPLPRSLLGCSPLSRQQKATLTFMSITSLPRPPAAPHALLLSSCRAPQVPLCLLLRPSGLSPASQSRTRGVWPLLIDKRTLWAAFPQSQTCPTSATSQGDTQPTPFPHQQQVLCLQDTPLPLPASKHPLYAGLWAGAVPTRLPAHLLVGGLERGPPRSPHLTDRDIEAQRGSGTHPRPQGTSEVSVSLSAAPGGWPPDHRHDANGRLRLGEQGPLTRKAEPGGACGAGHQGGQDTAPQWQSGQEGGRTC